MPSGYCLLALILFGNVLFPMFPAYRVYIAIRPKMEKHDVFISFRGADTRDTFLPDLLKALHNKSIKAFVDKNITGGDLIMPKLFEAINDSKVAVIIFSKNFAFSEDCLDELVKIVERHSHRQTCIPIFYKVSTSDVTDQSGDFEHAFVAHEEDPKVQHKVVRWRTAMTRITEHKGWDSKVTWPEKKLIEELIEHILFKLELMSAKYQPRRRWLPYFPLLLLIFVSMAVTKRFSQQQQAEAHEYDVFVNCYGEISLKNEIMDALGKEQISKFYDSALAGEKHFTKEIEKAIEESKVAVIIFSEGYASPRSLDELVKIIDCNQSQGLQLVPKCYHVDALKVKEPAKLYGKTLAEHTNILCKRKVQRWLKALTKATSLIPLPNLADTGNSIIPEIVAEVKAKLTTNRWAAVQKGPLSYTYILCLTVCSFLVSLLVLILSNEMLTRSLVGEIFRKAKCIISTVLLLKECY